MDQWRLVDCIDQADGPEDFPTLSIHSEAQLREELEQLRQRVPAIVGLSSPEQGGLRIGIGGPFAGISWGDQQRFHGSRRIVADQPYCKQPIDFAAEEGTLRHWPNELIP